MVLCGSCAAPAALPSAAGCSCATEALVCTSALPLHAASTIPGAVVAERCTRGQLKRRRAAAVAALLGPSRGAVEVASLRAMLPSDGAVGGRPAVGGAAAGSAACKLLVVGVRYARAKGAAAGVTPLELAATFSTPRLAAEQPAAAVAVCSGPASAPPARLGTMCDASGPLVSVIGAAAQPTSAAVVKSDEAPAIARLGAANSALPRAQGLRASALLAEASPVFL